MKDQIQTLNELAPRCDNKDSYEKLSSLLKICNEANHKKELAALRVQWCEKNLLNSKTIDEYEKNEKLYNESIENAKKKFFIWLNANNDFLTHKENYEREKDKRE